MDKKINKKKINEVEVAKKLENFRNLNKNFLYPSFDTIAGSGKNGAIVHYRAKKKTAEPLIKMIFYYVILVGNINMEQLMS